MAHKSLDEIREMLYRAAAAVRTGGVYSHYKSPDSRYKVLGLTILEASDEVAVRYASVHATEIEWIRPLDNRLQQTDGGPRFRLVEDE